jgi:hypothetical protein
MRPLPQGDASQAEYYEITKDGFPLQFCVIGENEYVTTSLIVAEVFGKRHSDVLRDVENLSCSQEFRERNFASSSYVSAISCSLNQRRLHIVRSFRINISRWQRTGLFMVKVFHNFVKNHCYRDGKAF